MTSHQDDDPAEPPPGGGTAPGLRVGPPNDHSVRGTVAGLSPGRLQAEIVVLAGRLSSGTYELLVLVGELDARGTWADWGALSCAAWLAQACDIDIGTARNQVRVARAMRQFPGLDVAMRAGEVSYSKARILVPHLTSTNEAALVELAAGTPAGALAAAIATWTLGHEPPADTHARHQRERSLTWRIDPDGMVTITARLPPTSAAAVTATIDHHILHTTDAPAGASLRQQRADALVTALTDPTGPPATEIVVHLRGEQPATLADGTPLSDHAVAALIPEAFISLLIKDMNDKPIDASPRRRHPTRRQRRVIDEAQPHCQAHGCGATAFLQYDHIIRYTDEGPTTIANLQRLCGPHNRARERARTEDPD